MPLTPGSRLGPYEVLALIGAGGMGAVYRGRDSKLNRDVALKVLPDSFANDPDRLARFQREAQVLASLNHPNIGHIHGLEESGGVRALVLELVEGPTLADRIAQGPIPLDEALPIARQIADALEAAHEKGVIHRDLKPANIKITPDGRVKVLDFGLAKMLETDVSGSALTMSPTLSLHATYAGVILGTAAYMSPEQARGRVVDKRTDVWAFGCVLFEMLSGARPFDGEDLAETIGAVIHKEPPWAALPAMTPATVRTVVQRCLEKDLKERVRDIGDVQLALKGAFESPAQPAATAPPTPVPRRRIIAAASVTLVVGATALITWAVMRPLPQPAPQPVRFTVAPAGTLTSTANSPYRDLALSPDGAHLVYTTGTSTSTLELWVRAVDQLDAVPLRGLLAPASPFISPDGKWIGFFSRSAISTQAGGNLMKVSMTGGPPILLCRHQGAPQGASWGPNDMIVFATTDPSTGLLSVPAGGGEPKVLTTPDAKHGEVDHLFPSVLPGGQAVLFTITATGGIDNAQVAVLDLKTGQRKILIRGGSAAEYVETGHLLYAAAGTLRAVRFDPVRLEVLGDPVPVVEQVLTKATGAAEFSVSRHGTLVYVPGVYVGPAAAPRSLVWVSRQGREEPIKAPPRAYFMARLSPDGMRIALDLRDQDNDIWTWDLAHETLTRITTDPAPDVFPVWTRDGRRILFASARNGVANLYGQSADGTGTAERLTTSQNPQLPLSISPDGTQVVVREVSGNGSSDLLLLHLDGPSTSPGGNKPPRTEPLVQTTFGEDNGIISPDGHWLAYESNESSQYQIYVRPFPNVNGGLRQVSSGGGHAPLWAPNGRELFYLDGNGLLTTVPVQTSTTTTFNFGKPTKLLDTRYFVSAARTYDVSPDGQRFLMIKDTPPASTSSSVPPPSLVVVLNWTEELKQRVPTR